MTYKIIWLKNYKLQAIYSLHFLTFQLKKNQIRKSCEGAKRLPTKTRSSCDDIQLEMLG